MFGGRSVGLTSSQGKPTSPLWLYSKPFFSFAVGWLLYLISSLLHLWDSGPPATGCCCCCWCCRHVHLSQELVGQETVFVSALGCNSFKHHWQTEGCRDFTGGNFIMGENPQNWIPFFTFPRVQGSRIIHKTQYSSSVHFLDLIYGTINVELTVPSRSVLFNKNISWATHVIQTFLEVNFKKEKETQVMFYSII